VAVVTTKTIANIGIGNVGRNGKNTVTMTDGIDVTRAGDYLLISRALQIIGLVLLLGIPSAAFVAAMIINGAPC
jgi:hypothetical protein